MSKFEEQLEDCRKYKDFLDKLTPPEWFEEQEAAKQRRKAERKMRKLAQRQAVLDEKASLAQAAIQAEADAEKARKGRRGRKDKNSEEMFEKEKQNAKAPILTLEDISDDDAPDDEEDVPMYFQEPHQLLDIFTALEESNLFLIQNSQETEEALEELKAKFAETRQRMEAESAGLKAQIDTLKGSIKVEEDKGRALLDRAGKNTGVHAQERTLDELNRKVAEVYRAIFSEADNSLGTLQMLTNIEARLEELLSIIDAMPREEVEGAEKQKEKERRQRVREAKQALAAKLQEERIQRSIRRSQEPVRRRVGKPIMFRSQPIQRKKKEVHEEKKMDEEDDVNFYLTLQ